MPRFKVLLKIRKLIGGTVKADEIWVESEGTTGLEAMESARLAYLAMGDPRCKPPVSVHNCVPLPAEDQPQVGKIPQNMANPYLAVQSSVAVSRETEVSHAQQVSEAAQVHGGGGTQPGVREERGHIANGGEGVPRGRQGKSKGGRPKGSKNKPKAVAATYSPEMQAKIARMIEAATNDAARIRWIKQQSAHLAEAPSVVALKWPAEKKRLIRTIPEMMPRDDVPPTPTPEVPPPPPVRPKLAGELSDPPGLNAAVEAAIMQDVANS